MSKIREKKHHKIVIGHIRPTTSPLSNFDYFTLPESSRGQSFKDNKFNSLIFNEYSFLFLLSELYNRGELNDGQITIAHYRRIVFNQQVGLQSANIGHNYVVNADNFSRMDISGLINPINGNFLIATPFRLPNDVMTNYLSSHHLRDILRFTGNLIDNGMLNGDDGFQLLTANLLVPSPLCGTFPLSKLMQIARKIETAAQIFWTNSMKCYYDPYQRRVLAFLLERLNSYLLLKLLDAEKLHYDSVAGFTTVVSETPHITVSRG